MRLHSLMRLVMSVSRVWGWCQQQPFASNPCHGVLLYQWRLELAHCLWVLHFTEFYPWPIYWPIVPALASSCCTCKTTDVKETRQRHLGTISLERESWDRRQEEWAWTLLSGKAWGVSISVFKMWFLGYVWLDWWWGSEDFCHSLALHNNGEMTLLGVYTKFLWSWTVQMLLFSCLLT